MGAAGFEPATYSLEGFSDGFPIVALIQAELCAHKTKGRDDGNEQTEPDNRN